MATMSSRDRARVYLRTYRDMIDRLRSIPDSDDDDAVRDRMALRAEWDNVAERVVQLDDMAQRGELTNEQIDEFASVARDLTALLPVLRERRYWLPDLDALGRAAARPTATPTS